LHPEALTLGNDDPCLGTVVNVAVVVFVAAAATAFVVVVAR
jgi:hypothetical protein